MIKYSKLILPTTGEQITYSKGQLRVPDHPIIPFIEGDGTGPDIWKASRKVFDAAVYQAYQGKRSIVWFEIFAGEKANDKYGEGTWLPEDTLSAIREFTIAIKGPLTTPVGGGIRSINVSLRQQLDLYVCLRPVQYFSGVPSPVKHPEKIDMVIFRENTEDIYAGIEFENGSKDNKRFLELFKEAFPTFYQKIRFPETSGIGIKPVSREGTERLVRAAIQYARRNGRKSVTFVHKGNIMKFTEGAFRDWGYELAREEFGDVTITEDELWEKHGGKTPDSKIVIKDRIADSMFQQILTRTDEYDIVTTPNLNGDYLSDACAAQVGGLGMAPGGNIGDSYAVFEATHGTAPKYAGQDKVNPGSVILSGVMMLQYLGWKEAADLIVKALEKTIIKKTVTYDLHRQIEGATLLKCSQFGEKIVENMDQV